MAIRRKWPCACVVHSVLLWCGLRVFGSWGESAGAISVALHMVSNGGNTEGLFRAGFMESGSPIPVGHKVLWQTYQFYAHSPWTRLEISCTANLIMMLLYRRLVVRTRRTPCSVYGVWIMPSWKPQLTNRRRSFPTRYIFNRTFYLTF